MLKLNYLEMDLESSIDRYLADEEYDNEEDQLAWEEEQDRIYDEMKERGMFDEPF